MQLNLTKVSNAVAKTIPHIFTAAGILWFGIGTASAFNLGVRVANPAETMDDYESLGKRFTKDILPVAGSFAIGTACVIMSDACNTRMLRAANIAYNNLAKNYHEYKAAVIGALGAEANKLAMKTAAEEHKPDISDEPSLPAGTYHFYDEYSRNDFVAEMADVLFAEYELNRKLQMDGIACVNDFYRLLNIYQLDNGEEKQWDAGELMDYIGYPWIEFCNVEHIEDDGSKWYSIHMMQQPTVDGLIDWDAFVNDQKVVNALFNH